MFKKFISLFLGLTAAAILMACTDGNRPADTQGEGKIKVSVTFDALKEFTEAVGGEKVEVSTVVPDGSSAHDFEPKAQDLIKLGTVRIFVCNGLGMEGWADEAVKSADNENLIVVDSSEGADIIINTDDADVHSGEDANADEVYDPHLWLGLKGAQTQATNIKEALIQADPDNKSYYEDNCAVFTSQLENLYNEYIEKFRSLDNRSFVTGHAAFGYLCRDFGLTQNSVMDIYADGEPSAKQLVELVEYCRENGVTTIFAEDMASPAVSRTLADEVGAKVETIYTIESSEDGKSYLDRMRDNLSKIFESMSR